MAMAQRARNLPRTLHLLVEASRAPVTPRLHNWNWTRGLSYTTSSSRTPRTIHVLHLRHFNRAATEPLFVRPSNHTAKYVAVVAILASSLLYYIQRAKNPPLITSLISSPSLIPHQPLPHPFPPISSPLEREKNLFQLLAHLLKTRILEPIRTGFRFLHLVIIFTPVLLSAPMLLVGAEDAEHEGDRWGAIWWFDLLVQQMQRAGPTFIKVCPQYHSLFSISFTL